MEPKWNQDGLAPALVQDAGTGQVLMLAWMNAEAWQRTLESGQSHFWSRSRQALWHKGETSGNIQRVVEIRLDCDSDAILLRVEPAGPACHTGAQSCFFTTVVNRPADIPSSLSSDLTSTQSVPRTRPREASDLQSPISDLPRTRPPSVDTPILHKLYQLILDRRQNPPPGSYTARLFEQGLAEIAKKVGEESVEVIVAALGQSPQRLVSETADLLYHTLVLLAARDVPLSSVEHELEQRRK